MAQPRARLGLALGLVTMLTACGGGGAADDAGHDGASADGALQTCTTPTVCDVLDSTKVRACREGVVAEISDDCAPTSGVCSRGRCTSSACALAEGNLGSIVGCSFTTLHLDNVSTDDVLPASVLVTNPGQSAATATLERRAGGRWSAIASAAVPPMRSARLALPASHIEGGGPAAQAALRLETDLPVSVIDIQSDGTTDVPARSSGATQLLPVHVLGQRYRAMAYPQIATQEIENTMGGREGAGQLVIVGTQDGTSVTVKTPPGISFDAEGAPPQTQAGAYALALDEGDYYQLYSGHDGDDLTGTEIVADKPIAVFSGNISTTYGEDTMGISSPDLAHEQMLPVGNWSTSYVAAALPPEADVCDGLFPGGPSSIWRILADRDNTQVTFVPDDGVTGPFSPRTLAAGEVFRIIVPVATSFAVTASSPVAIMQGTDCEATLSSAVPAEPLLSDYWFATLPVFDSLVAIVRHAGRPIYLDGARIDDASFTRAGNGFEVAQLRLTSCPAAEGLCTHHLEGQFGVTMRGEDVLTSWALTAPTWECSDPDVLHCPK